MNPAKAIRDKTVEGRTKICPNNFSLAQISPIYKARN